MREMPEGVVLAPRDDREGGTWIGLNGNGVFAALTNRSSQATDPSRRSRGLLVMDVLAEKTPEGAVERIRALSRQPEDLERADVSDAKVLEGGEAMSTGLAAESRYNPFNMVIADRDQAFAVTYLEEPEVFTLEPGVHVIGNVGLHETSPKLDHIALGARRMAAGPNEDVMESLAQVCRGHDGDSFDAACVHTEEYGTRSSILLRLDEGSPGDGSETFGPQSSFHYADGEPCRNPYLDFTPLLRELDRKARIVEGESSARSER